MYCADIVPVANYNRGNSTYICHKKKWQVTENYLIVNEKRKCRDGLMLL